MQDGKIYVSELSASKHIFHNYHFCPGNSYRRKTRIGVIIKGGGTYFYLNKKFHVNEGDLVFIPENIYCYSEWRGTPEIEVVYVSCFMHYERFRYEPQIIYCNKNVKKDITEIADLLSTDYIKELEAYSLFYKLLQKVLPLMAQSKISYDKTLQTAIEFITVRFQNSIKINVAMEYLENQNYSVTTISHLVGFHSENHFRKVFADITGTTPLKYRKRT